MSIATKKMRAAAKLGMEGRTVRQIANDLGISPASAARACQRFKLRCRQCEAKLLKPAQDGLCGFCAEERKPEDVRL